VAASPGAPVWDRHEADRERTAGAAGEEELRILRRCVGGFSRRVRGNCSGRPPALRCTGVCFGNSGERVATHTPYALLAGSPLRQ